MQDSTLESLAENHPRDHHHDPGYDWYDATSEAYVLRPLPSSAATDAWAIFVEQVRHHGRFFNHAALQYLDNLFGPLLTGELHDGKQPLLTLGAPNSQVKHIFRARMANTSDEQRAIYANPRRELSAPPPGKRRAKRMNAAGIPAFYGALDAETCVAELRPSVHGYAVVGKFSFVRPVEVLDLRVVDNATQQLSLFDPEFADKLAAGEFMRRLHDIIRVPVFPGAELLDYVPTQVIAEYLAERGVAGILYVSSLVDRPEADDDEGYIYPRAVDNDGVNIVLFSRASIVIGQGGGDEFDIVRLDEPHVDELLGGRQYVLRRKREDQADLDVDYPLVDDAVLPTMELLAEDVFMMKVRSIKHKLEKIEIWFVEKDEVKEVDPDLPF